MIRILSLFFLAFSLISCSSSATDNNESERIVVSPITEDKNTIKIEKIASQPLVYHDTSHIEVLQSGYGTFGTHEVATKTIPNQAFPNLQTMLYYPKDLTQNRPTLFFYAGAGVSNANTYKALFYFIASKGYNIIFITYADYNLRPLPSVSRDALEEFSNHIDKTRVGFLGHSMGAGAAFWLINQLSELGSNARILFPLASGYSAFNVQYNMIPSDKIIALPANTKMIQQVYAKDYSTDVRIGIDLFLNNSLTNDDKDFMFIYGDENHIADHMSMASQGDYDYNAFMQRTIFRPLDALMDEAFNQNIQARMQLKKESQNDPYFTPYIGKNPQIDIDKSYIFEEDFYPFNCSEVRSIHLVSIRKEYCKALGL